MYDISVWKHVRVAKGKGWETMIRIKIKLNKISGRERAVRHSCRHKES